MKYSTQFLDVSVRTFSLAYLGKLVSRSKVPEAWVLVSVKSRSIVSTVDDDTVDRVPAAGQLGTAGGLNF